MNTIEKAKAAIVEEIKRAAIAAGLAEAEQIPNFVLEIPKEKTHGDYATNIAMQLTKIAKKPPRQIAEAIVAEFSAGDVHVLQTDIAGPGFINFHMDTAYLGDIIVQVIDAGDEYGSINDGQQQKVQVEFVSANPTGSLHLGHARGAAVGDALCNVLAMAGYDVSREYYINDAGNQIANLAYSIEARYLQALGQEAELPEDGYQGEDILEFGRQLAEEAGDRYTKLEPTERFDFFREYGLEREIEKLKQDLKDYRVEFDVWFSETSLYETGEVKEIVSTLRERGYVFDEDGATWLRSMDFGDDKNRVLIKNDGSYTYLTPDIAYHQDKFSRGFEKLINIWGADHHGYIPRMKAAMQSLGYKDDQLHVIVNQMVNLYQGGERVKMSKRTGRAVSMRELMEEVGTDATRYFFTMRSSDAHLDFDMDLAVSESNENPVFYVQYAHARICSIFRRAKEEGIDWQGQQPDLKLLQTDKEIELLQKIGQFPEEISLAAEHYAPHRIVRYVHDLATIFHSFYNAAPVITEDRVLSYSRLNLLCATQITLRNALRVIGVNAPERM